MNDNPLKSFRIRPAALVDAAAIAKVLNDCSIERTGKPQATAEYVRGVMQRPGLNLETDSLLAIGPNEQLVGYAMAQDTAPHTTIFVLSDVHPQYRDRSIWPSPLSLGRRACPPFHAPSANR